MPVNMDTLKYCKNLRFAKYYAIILNFQFNYIKFWDYREIKIFFYLWDFQRIIKYSEIFNKNQNFDIFKKICKFPFFQFWNFHEISIFSILKFPFFQFWNFPFFNFEILMKFPFFSIFKFSWNFHFCFPFWDLQEIYIFPNVPGYAQIRNFTTLA